MKRLLFIVAVLILFTGVGLCEEVKMDGWGKVKWGMSEDAVKLAEIKVEASESNQTEKYYFPLILKNVKIADVNFTALFRFDKSSKTLNAVTLFPPNDLGNIFLFDRIFDLLLTKYGKPLKNEEKTLHSWRSREALWIVDKTKISLHLEGNTNIKELSIFYEKLEKNDIL